MQQLADLVEDEGDGIARLVLGRAVRPLQQGLGQLEAPVAENIPDEAIGRVGRLVELVLGQRGFDFGCRPRRFADDPAVEDFPSLVGSKPWRPRHWFISAKRAAFHSLVAKLR